MPSKRRKDNKGRLLKTGEEPKKGFDIHVSLHRYERETTVCLRRRFE